MILGNPFPAVFLYCGYCLAIVVLLLLLFLLAALAASVSGVLKFFSHEALDSC